MTEAERKLWFGYLRNFKYPVLRQRLIDNYIVDFYCPKLKLAVEIDGDTHYSDEGKMYDEKSDFNVTLRVCEFIGVSDSALIAVQIGANLFFHKLSG